jgi:NAD(P)H dehydrogenase (quinone)
MARKVLITGATGDTGRAAVKEAIALELDVRAMVHSKDVRSEALEKVGAEVVLGDLLEIDTFARQWKVPMPPILSGLLRRD